MLKIHTELRHTQRVQRLCCCLSKRLCPLFQFKSREHSHLCLLIFVTPHLDSWSYLLRQLHVQALLTGVQTVDHLLILQLARANHQPRQIPAEKLSHSRVSTWVCQNGDEEKKTPTHRRKQLLKCTFHTLCLFWAAYSSMSSQCAKLAWMKFMQVSMCALTRPEAQRGDRRMMDGLINAFNTCNICNNHQYCRKEWFKQKNKQTQDILMKLMIFGQCSVILMWPILGPQNAHWKI